MPEAEGKKFDFKDEKSIRTDFLETVEYDGGKQLVEYKTKEFSAVCPFSGLPDIAEVTIRYIPSKKIVELKSLKYYFISFRNVGIYQEKVTDRIFKDLKKILKPEYLCVETIYNTRGGIDSKCVMETNEHSRFHGVNRRKKM
ncbi:MAG: NADPH-dependent 7-cyano-7-deazaguanine reductase QueF [Candidatus Goldbacteria bacterium]|nr:NADPH-dependent 7-cyano-7-deazaguanine reductase QueF [Candidatus Goldiibacteriota bacterium]